MIRTGKKQVIVLFMVLALIFSTVFSPFLKSVSALSSEVEAEYTSEGENPIVETGSFADMLQKANANGGTVKLLSDVTFAANTGAKITGNAVTLDLNGYEIASTLSSSTYGTFASYSGTRPITIQANGVLTLIDSKANSDTPGNIKNGVEVVKGGTFTMESGSISNSVGFNGVQNNGVFTMNGGTISNNTHQRIGAYGGGVNNTGTFIMNGGKINNNTNYSYGESSGGGVYSKGNSATFTMSGGEILGNTLQSYNEYLGNGGGVYVKADGEFTDGVEKNYLSFSMTGGTISKNTIDGYGGGVYIVGGGYKNVYTVFTMDGGTISENESGRSGGGIYIDNNSRVNITKGSISNNKSERSGGGIGIYNTFTTGGAWGSYMPGELHLKNVVITENTAKNYVYNDTDYGSYGGGIATCPTSATYIYLTDGGAIFGNTSTHGELLAQQINQGTDHQHLLYLSGYMLGGGAYQWTDLDGNSLDTNQLMNLADDDFMATNEITATSAEAQTAKKLAQVFIMGNEASYMGGGIMNNGILTIGTSDASLRVEKQVINNENPIAFPFVVEFWSEDEISGQKVPYTEPISYNKTGSNTILKATPDSTGKVTFELSASDWIVFYGLSEGLHYQVVENEDGAYETEYSDNANGIIQNNEFLDAVTNVVFTNTFTSGSLGNSSTTKNPETNSISAITMATLLFITSGVFIAFLVVWKKKKRVKKIESFM